MSDNEEVYNNNNNNNLSNEMSQMRLDITNLTNMFAQFMQHSSESTVIKTEFVKPIALIINPTTFKTFRDDFLQVALETGLMSYINNTYEQVCSIVQKRNPNVDRESIELSVQTQSSSMTAALQRGLHSHWGRHNDSMLHAAALLENADLFIEYNINWVWSDILKTYQTVSKFSRVNLMASMFHVKHNINDNPSIILEKN